MVYIMMEQAQFLNQILNETKHNYSFEKVLI